MFTRQVMNKSDFFQLLEENHSEIVMAKTTVKTFQRGSVVELVLSIQGYGVFTLSRHKPSSKTLSENEEKFARWFTEWSESASSTLEAISDASVNIEISPVEPSFDLFEVVEFVSMKVIPDWQMKKKPDGYPAKVTQHKRDKDHPQTYPQFLSAWRSVIAGWKYYLPSPPGMNNLSEFITYVFNRRRYEISHLLVFHRLRSVCPLVMARSRYELQKVTDGLWRRSLWL